MSKATLEQPRRLCYRRQVLIEAMKHVQEPPTDRRGEWLRHGWRYGFALLLALYLLFAHGCHDDDEDHELMARPAETVARQ